MTPPSDPIDDETVAVTARPPSDGHPAAAVLATGVVVALLVSVLVGVGWVVIRSATGPADVPFACPASRRWLDGSNVPVRPTVARLDGIIPQQAPSDVLLCEYEGAVDPDDDGPGRAIALARSAHLAGGDPAVAPLVDALQQAPILDMNASISCVKYAGIYSVPPLAGFRYDDGVVWVSTDGGGCVPTSNGEMRSEKDFETQIGAALDRTTGPAGSAGPS